MRKILIASGFIVFLLAGSLTFSSCCNNDTSKTVKNNDKAKTVQAKEITGYQCPMKCEGDKTYDHPGKCPVCGMKLEKVEKKQ